MKRKTNMEKIELYEQDFVLLRELGELHHDGVHGKVLLIYRGDVNDD